MTTPRRPVWPASVSRPVVSPIQPAVVYASDGPDMLDDQYEGRAPGYTYAREGHPNADALAGMIDAMEGAKGGIVTGSGMAAVTAGLLGVLRAGDHVLGGDQLYGRSLRLINETLPALGIEASTTDPTDVAAVEAALRPNTRVVLIEVVSNPTIRVADVAGIAALCRDRGVLLAIDNTFTTPRSFRPFDHGADIVIHSVTKLLAGHSDATLGYVATRDPDLRSQINVLAVTMGLTASPFDCWLAERGLLTFTMRYDRAEANAAALADALAAHPGVRRVLYPQRPDHPDHKRARGLLGDRGSHMLSFEIAGGRAEANTLIAALPSIPFAPTLGDISTTISHAATSSHRALSEAERSTIGISEGFFRVSVGCEEPEDLRTWFLAGLDQL
ncbi:MAG: aminotransferase class I/II-fold pyridoxal phosphate-dependent enzyme [Pseudomonadota bacterium]